MSFELHPNLRSKIFVVDLPLCRLLLEDERHYPWLMLVPRRESISRIAQLERQDKLQLLDELDLAQNYLWETLSPDQINVAAIGNKTSQLHIHVIARSQSDPAWPGTVWDHPVREPYPKEELEWFITSASNMGSALP